MIRDVEPYSALAKGYDFVMAHVDYEGWAEYIDLILREHNCEPGRVIELGCGTASFLRAFSRHRHVHYLATDQSEDMLAIARSKCDGLVETVDFACMNFTEIPASGPYDAALLLYDGLNYVTDPNDIKGLFASVYNVLDANGLFIFDQVTPANSINNQSFFEDSGTRDGFSYHRKSAYDAECRMHETVLELNTGSECFLERHVQRVYLYSEIRDILEQSPLTFEAAYADYTLKPGLDSAERIHWVARKIA